MFQKPYLLKIKNKVNMKKTNSAIKNMINREMGKISTLGSVVAVVLHLLTQNSKARETVVGHRFERKSFIHLSPTERSGGSSRIALALANDSSLYSITKDIKISEKITLNSVQQDGSRVPFNKPIRKAIELSETDLFVLWNEDHHTDLNFQIFSEDKNDPKRLTYNAKKSEIGKARTSGVLISPSSDKYYLSTMKINNGPNRLIAVMSAGVVVLKYNHTTGLGEKLTTLNNHQVSTRDALFLFDGKKYYFLLSSQRVTGNFLWFIDCFIINANGDPELRNFGPMNQTHSLGLPYLQNGYSLLLEGSGISMFSGMHLMERYQADVVFACKNHLGAFLINSHDQITDMGSFTMNNKDQGVVFVALGAIKETTYTLALGHTGSLYENGKIWNVGEKKTFS